MCLQFVLQFVRMCCQYLVDGLLYEIMDFVGSYYLENYIQ